MFKSQFFIYKSRIQLCLNTFLINALNQGPQIWIEWRMIKQNTWERIWNYKLNLTDDIVLFSDGLCGGFPR